MTVEYEDDSECEEGVGSITTYLTVKKTKQ